MPLVVYGQILRLRSLAFTSLRMTRFFVRVGSIRLRMTHCPRSFSPPKNVGNATSESECVLQICGNAAGKSEWAFHNRGNAASESERGLLCHFERKTAQAVWSRRIWLSFFIMTLVVYGQILRLRSLAFTTLRMTHFFVHWRSLRLRMTRFFVRVGSIRYE